MKVNRRIPWVRITRRAIAVLDRYEREVKQAEERWARFTKKGDRRPIEAIESGKATVQRKHRQRSAKCSSARRLAQRKDHGARLVPREMSAAASTRSQLFEASLICVGICVGAAAGNFGHNDKIPLGKQVEEYPPFTDSSAECAARSLEHLGVAGIRVVGHCVQHGSNPRKLGAGGASESAARTRPHFMLPLIERHVVSALELRAAVQLSPRAHLSSGIPL